MCLAPPRPRLAQQRGTLFSGAWSWRSTGLVTWIASPIRLSLKQNSSRKPRENIRTLEINTIECRLSAAGILDWFFELDNLRRGEKIRMESKMRLKYLLEKAAHSLLGYTTLSCYLNLIGGFDTCEKTSQGTRLENQKIIIPGNTTGVVADVLT